MSNIAGIVRASLGWMSDRIRLSLMLACLGLLGTATAGRTADSIIITYGFFERTVEIEDLEAFANGQGLSRQLSEYARTIGLTDAELETLRQILRQRADLDEVDIAQFLYTNQGRQLLRFVGNVIQTPSRQSGFKAIRAALILAAADDTEGLTVLNFLREYPTPAIRIDVGTGLEIAEAIAGVLGDSERAFALVEGMAADAVAQAPPDLTQEVRQLVYAQTSYLVDTRLIQLPFRGVNSTLYLPRVRNPAQSLPGDVPLIIISHGLGDERRSYDYLARFLTSRGFAVATLDHPGSNSNQIAQLLSGFSPELVADREFIDRPQDISELIDEIQRVAFQDINFRWRLDTQNVGLIGQSFGGYTALALAGATYDADGLAAACEPQPIYLNPSLLLQCQAENVTATVPNLKDERVQAILVINPIGSSIFGPSGFGELSIPVMMMAATADTVAPALPEQIKPFTWLQTEHRYLALVNGATHFSVIDWDQSASPSIPIPSALLGRNPEIAQEYLETLSWSFFQLHLNQNRRYEEALTPEFAANYIVRSPVEPLSVIQDLPAEDLDRVIEDRAPVTLNQSESEP